MLMHTWGRSILAALLLLALPAFSTAQISLDVSVNFPPPELPVYEQPPIPGDGYVWTPGYWAWGDDSQDYYWVPGTWVLAPQPEYLWTPGYWAADGAIFFFHSGYWGPHVGFYGGVNYGYGYGGEGYEGGYWQGGRMYYNRSVNNISNTNITNVYNKTVINNVSVTRVSYNGGSGGVRAQPTPADQQAAHDRHMAVTPVQNQHLEAARSNPVLRASQNNGRPPIAATPRPAAFTGAGVVSASRGGTVHANPQANPQARAPQPVNRGPQTETRAAQPEYRPENRTVPPQPRMERAPAAEPPRQQAPFDQRQEQRQPVQRPPVEQQRQPVMDQRPRVEQQSRPPVEQSRPPVMEQSRPPVMEQRRPPEQAPPPRPSAPPPPRPEQRAEPPRPEQRAEPRPAEHPPARDGDREHH